MEEQKMVFRTEMNKWAKLEEVHIIEMMSDYFTGGKKNGKNPFRVITPSRTAQMLGLYKEWAIAAHTEDFDTKKEKYNEILWLYQLSKVNDSE
tara:strand:- start:31 stop:309 length:279 start_codon:yes stop_codon:yes gene_type:complete